MKRYFYITIHFLPRYEGTVLEKCSDGLYMSTETGEIYRKRLLYDFGWGQENGFELTPPLSFDGLIKLVEEPMIPLQKKFWRKRTKEEAERFDVWRSNLYGAVAVIMQDYVKELVEFLSVKVDTDYFFNPNTRENFKCFCFDSQKARADGKISGGVLARSYEDIFKDCPSWNRISSDIIEQVYK